MITRLKQPPEEPRVGLFGLLGSGNIGNDASMEAVLRYVQTRHPSVVIDVMCSGPERVTEQYGVDAVQMFWFDRHHARLSGPLRKLPEDTEPVSSMCSAFGLGTSARRSDRARRRRPGSEPPVATVGHPLWALPAQRIRQALQNQGRLRQRRGRRHPQAGHAMVVQLGGPVGLLPGSYRAPALAK